MAWIERVFSADGFMPHGHCYLWEPHILWLHLISDAVIGLSYFSIPVVLMLFSARRGDLKLNAIFYAFSAFIVACGLTHLSSIATIWYPYYLPQGLLKGVTAAISLATASVLWLILPRLVALPSPARLAAANEQLANEIALRREMEALVKSQNQDLRAGSRALAMRDHALAQAAAAIAIADLAGEIAYCNQSFADLIGLAGPDEAVGLNALQFAPDGEAALGQLLQHGRWIGEVQIRRPDGSVRETAVAASMVDFGDSSPHRIIASFMDVTDQRDVQRALARSEARLANAQRLARMGNWEWDIAADQFSWSDEVRAMFSMADDADSAGLAGVLDYVHPDDRETFRARLQRCLAGPPGTFSMDYRVPRADGSVATMHGQAETIFDADGKAIRMTGTVQDISERKQAEAASRRTEAFLDLIVENIPAMLFVKDAQELRFVTLNRAGEDLLGYDRTELIGRNDHDLFPPDQADAFIRADRAVIAAGRPLVVPEEAVNTRQQGQRLLRTIKIPVHDEAGAPLYLLGFSTDITEQIQLEQQFRQAQKMETVGHLTGGVAHDFNNVLMALQLNLEMVQERLAGDEEGTDALRIALNAVERGAALTGRLLAFSRKQPLQPATINVNTLVREMMRLLHRTLEEDLDVETVLAAGVWSIEVDPAQLENALINLAVNARDAMPEGGKLTIETANTRLDDEYARQYDEVRAGQYVMIAVSDTGTGMTPDVLERAFDPFFTTKDVGKGSGLGLSMVYGFVKQSGGHVKIYSELGQGTTVKLYFPRTAMTAASPDRIDAALPIRSGKETVLLVEDDPSVRLAVRRSLDAFGYAVHSVGTGEDALQLVRDGLTPDLLLADVVLPGGMSGREVSDAIVLLAPSCRTLYMSGYTDNAIVHHGRLDVGVTLISKPFTRQTLATKIREVLDAD